MEKCRNLDKDYVEKFTGFGFRTYENGGNPNIEFGKYSDGKLECGIRYFKKSTTLQMGMFNTTGVNDLICGFKKFSDGNICVAKKFASVDGVGLTGEGYCVHLDTTYGKWKYGNFVDGKDKFGVIKCESGIYIYDELLKYYESDNHLQPRDEIDISKYEMRSKGSFYSLDKNMKKMEMKFYNLERENFDKFTYNNCEVYAMGNKNKEDGLGYIEWENGEKYIGEWKKGKRHGFGIYFYENSTMFAYYDEDRATELKLKIYNSGSIEFGSIDSKIPQFTLLNNNNFIIQNCGDNAVYIKPNFKVSIEEYDDDKWVRKVEDLDLYTGDNQDIRNEDNSNNVNNTTNSKLKEEVKLNVGQAEEELNKLIGLDSVKKELKRIKAYLAKYKDEKLNLHMVFTGCPGTGKTVVARLLGKILYEEKILPKDTFIEASREHLIGEYIGHTAVKTNQIIEDAMGGVLFIDEAYSLNARSEKDFGHEAVAELLKKMEDKRGEFCCIMAGYTKEMEDFIAINPGFKSRVQFFIDFPNYKKDELKQIAQIFLKKKKLIVSNEVVDKIIDIVWLREKDKDFSNAREVRILIDKLTMIQSERTIGDIDNREIILEDIETYIKEHNIKFIAENDVTDKDVEKSGTVTDDNAEVESEQPAEEETTSKVEEINSNNEEAYIAPKIPMMDYFELRESNKGYKPQHYMANKLDLLESIVAIMVKDGEEEFESSGFTITDNGYIATAAHCVDYPSAQIRVRRRIWDRLGNKVDVYYDANIVAIDNENDIAIIKIDVDGHIPYLRLLNEKAIDFEPTRSIAVLGYPFGVSRFDNLSISEGKIVSYQKVKNKRKVINLDCDLKQGNSGSCVIDIETGVVIGVFSGAHGIDNDEYKEEINYCIPTEYLWKLIKKHQED